jgi:hypothetical protein
LLLIAKRRRVGEPVGEQTLLLHFAMVIPIAVIAGVGEPRYRTVYDLLGIALLAAVVADRWLDRRESR